MPLKPPRPNHSNLGMIILIIILFLIIGCILYGVFFGLNVDITKLFKNLSRKSIQENFEWEHHNDLLSKMGRNVYEHHPPYLGIQQASTLENASSDGAKLPQSIGGGGEIPLGLWFHPVPDWDAPYELKELQSLRAWEAQFETRNQPVIEAQIALQKQAE
jgi:hypothetical protein